MYLHVDPRLPTNQRSTKASTSSSHQQLLTCTRKPCCSVGMLSGSLVFEVPLSENQPDTAFVTNFSTPPPELQAEELHRCVYLSTCSGTLKQHNYDVSDIHCCSVLTSTCMWFRGRKNKLKVHKYCLFIGLMSQF